MDGARREASGSLDELVASLADLEAGPRSFGALFRLGDQAVDALEEFLRGPAESIPQPRCLAAEILAAIGTPRARAALRRALETCVAREDLDPVFADAERTVASAIGDHLGALHDRAAADLLVDVLRRHAWPGCARALGRLRDARAIPLLAHRLDDDGARTAVVEALRTFGPAAIPELCGMLLRHWEGSGAEPAWRIAGRAAAADLLGDTGAVAARLPLVWSLADPAPPVRLAVAVALLHFGDEAASVALPVLIDALASEGWVDADIAGDALVGLGDLALSAVSAVVASGASEIVPRRRAIVVLGRLGVGAAAGALAVAARSADPVVRLASATALSSVPGAQSVSALRRLLEDKAPEVRVRAVDALGRRGSGGLRIIASSLGDPDDRVRRVARQALQQAGDRATSLLLDVSEGRLLCRGGWTGTRRARSTAATLLRALREKGTIRGPRLLDDGGPE